MKNNSEKSSKKPFILTNKIKESEETTKFIKKLATSGKHICPICKKVFYTQTAEWGYKVGSKKGKIYFCTWGCLREFEKMREWRKAEREESKRRMEKRLNGMELG